MPFDLAQFRLDGRVALVVGASRGIGLSIGQTLHAAGASVALAARSAAELEAAAAELSASGPAARGFPVDVRDPRDVQALVADVHAAFGRLDVLVNCAGLNVRRPADEITQEDWDVVFDVNIRAMFFTCQAAARVMREQGGGAILNIASGADLLAVNNVTPYAVSKAGVRQLTRSLAAEWAGDGIRVNGVAPGRVRTHQTEAVFADPVRHAEVVRSIPLGRSSVPEDIAGTVLLLVSDAGEYITGQTLSVDGGWNLGRVGGMMATQSHRALLMDRQRHLTLVEEPRPAVTRPDDVLVRVHAVGVCGSDLHGYTGHTGRRVPPLVMGHEATGEVVAVGDGVRGLAIGDRVATNTIAACGRCRPCLSGERSLCENRLIMGMSAPGAYAEYVVWPEDSLPRLPEGLSYEVGALAEPLAVALHGVNMAGIRPGDDVFIAGGGPIGVLVHVLVRMAGAGRILVSDMHPARLATARALGADIVIDASAQDVVEVVREATGGSGADVSIEAVGAGATARHTIDATRNAGTVVWLGNSDDRIEIGMQTLVTRNLNVRGSYGMTSQEFERALGLLAAGRLPVDEIVNRYATLDEGPELFEQLLADPETIKCIIRP